MNVNEVLFSLETQIKALAKRVTLLEKKKRAVFKIPTLTEIREYCETRKNCVSAVGFYNFYESKGWMIGKNKMKSWKAAVRTWEKNSDGQIAPRMKTLSEQMEKQDGNMQLRTGGGIPEAWQKDG